VRLDTGASQQILANREKLLCGFARTQREASYACG
jgi:hypothetical protein